MVLAKNIVTLVLALLLANPACCCALGGTCSLEQAEKAPVRSCCSNSSEDEENNDAPSEHECMCSLNKQYTEHGQFSLPGPDFSLLPEPSIVFIDVDPLAPDRITYLPRSKRLPPGPALRILFSVFRL